MNPEHPHALYRFFDAEDRLLYIGITWDIASRFPQHRDEKPWWMDIRNITIEPHADRAAALAAEKAAIIAERPVYNIVHNRFRWTQVRPVTAWDQLCEYAAELRLMHVWTRGVARQYQRFTGDECCGVEIWYGHGEPIRAFLGDMGIRDVAGALAGWDAGDRIWPAKYMAGRDLDAPLSSAVELEALLLTADELPDRLDGPRSETWTPPPEMYALTSAGRLLSRIVCEGWNPPAELRTSQAYDVVYEHLLAEMPRCGSACGCVSEAA
jgi:hypothetical protein